LLHVICIAEEDVDGLRINKVIEEVQQNYKRMHKTKNETINVRRRFDYDLFTQFELSSLVQVC